MPAQVMITQAARVIVGSMLVRTPRDDDFPALAAITNHYIATTAVHFAYDAIGEAELRAQWQRYREQLPWFTAEHGGAIVGYAKAGTWRERTAYRWTTELGLYVAEPE